MLGLASGARRGELLAVQWPDINFESGMMTITKSLEQTKAGLRVKCTKSDEPRRFALPAAALDALRDHRIEQDPDKAFFGSDDQDNQLVFCRPEGGYYSPDRVGARVSELMKKVGLEGVSLHSCATRTRASFSAMAYPPDRREARNLANSSAEKTVNLEIVEKKVD
jgi:integrase